MVDQLEDLQSDSKELNKRIHLVERYAKEHNSLMERLKKVEVICNQLPTTYVDCAELEKTNLMLRKEIDKVVKKH
jgi:hypothetical protein